MRRCCDVFGPLAGPDFLSPLEGPVRNSSVLMFDFFSLLAVECHSVRCVFVLLCLFVSSRVVEIVKRRVLALRAPWFEQVVVVRLAVHSCMTCVSDAATVAAEPVTSVSVT